ncbi:MAG TPA: VCBS repeat-containing protein [Kofleriaceae bacterium]|nr:VCBS repeat-containing protein [Kofleriaceae bacterium]
MILMGAGPIWDDATPSTIGTTAQWTSKVELADLDGDGWVDIFFPNGGDYATAGTPEPQRVFQNLGNWASAGPHFMEISASVFGNAGTRLSRVIKVRDVDGDGDMDVFVGGAHGTDSALFVQGPAGVFTDASAHLPPGKVYLGDAELGDVDGDGDLDLVLADWGGAPQQVTGGLTKLWLNDGHGVFTDATSQLPQVKLGMSWDLEVIDFDDDGDLDVLVSSKLSAGGRAYVNDGSGHFTDETTARLPQRKNNYEYEPMDLDGDGDLDLVTINDGPQLTETVLINDGAGVFEDETSSRITGTNNLANADDNVDTWLDVDDDGDADFLIGSLSDADRLMRNDGTGHFTRDDGVLTTPATPGTLGLAVADLNHDGRLDVVMSQGEVASPDFVFLANAGVAVDTQPPVARVIVARPDGTVIARVHDHQSPSRAGDWKQVVITDGASSIDMTWRGEYEWAATVPTTPGVTYRVCATDAAGNQGCSDPFSVGGDLHDDVIAPDAPPGDHPTTPGGCCDASGAPASSMSSFFGAVLVVVLRRRR